MPKLLATYRLSGSQGLSSVWFPRWPLGTRKIMLGGEAQTGRRFGQPSLVLPLRHLARLSLRWADARHV